MIRATISPPAPPKPAAREERLPFQFSTSTIQHITYEMAARMLHVVYQVAHGNVSQATVEEVRRIEFILRDRKHAEVKAGHAKYMRAWRERGRAA